MPTLDDLRAVFTDLEQRAPLPQPLPSTDHTTRPMHDRGARRHDWTTAIAAAAAVATVATGVTVFATRSHQQGATTAITRPPAQSSPSSPKPAQAAFSAALPEPNGSSPQLRFGFTVGPVAGYRVTPVSIDASSQTAEVHSTDRVVKGELRIYYAGAYDPAAAERGTPVTVDDRPGYYTRLQLPGDDTARYEVLAWQYADGGWAVIDLWDGAAGRTVKPGLSHDKAGVKHDLPVAGTHGQPDLGTLRLDDLRVATATHAADTVARVPIKITGLTGEVIELTPDPSAGGLTLRTGSRTWDFGWGNISLNPADKPDTDTTTVDGRQWLIYHDRISGTIMSLGLSGPGFGMTVTPIGGSATMSDYQEFLAHVSFPTDLGDPDTWFDADTALP